MPNYQTGVLFASAGDVYTQLMDIIKTYIEARGWTTNLYVDYRFKYTGDDYTGKRLHAEKTIDTIDRFINIRSMKNQQIFNRSGNDQVSGIGVIGSTDYDGATDTVSFSTVSNVGGFAQFFASPNYAAIGDTITVSGTGVGGYDTTHTVTGRSISTVLTSTAYISNASGTLEFPSRWDAMTGYTLFTNPGDINPQGGGALDLPEDVLTYFLFSENSGDNIYLICSNSTGFTGITFGTTTTGNYFVGGANTISSSDYVTNALMGNINATTTNGTLALRKKDDSDWFGWTVNGNGGVQALQMHNTNTGVNSLNVYQLLLFCSPDNFKGNNPLIPIYMGEQIAAGKSNDAGVIPGMKCVNMKFMDSLTELTFGGDVWKLFRLYTEDDANDATVGLAILK